jgi:spermidine synthase
MFGYFYPDAAEILAKPNAHVIVTDGRNHLELTTKRYDIIVTDPPPPIFSSGASVISSLEYYQAGHDHLAPGGVMMQWIPWGASIDEFRAHVRTFRSVFAHMSILFGPGGYGLFMLGSDDPISFDEATERDVLARPGILEDISSAYDSRIHTADEWIARIAGLRWIDDAQIDAFVGQGPLITDDRPIPEYFLLRKLTSDSEPASRCLVLQLTGRTCG